MIARRPIRYRRGWLCLGLWLFLGLTLAQITTTSPTFDEGFGVLRGYAAWRTGHLLPIGHPPLAHWLSGALVLTEPNLPDPVTLRGWAQDKYDEASHDLLWERGLNADRVVFLARYSVVLLGLLTGALTTRWAREWWGWPGGLTALGAYVLSPNILAHSAVATTDVPVMAFYVLTLYAWQRLAIRPNFSQALFLGVALGCALATKFSALLLLPTLGLLACLPARPGERLADWRGYFPARLRLAPIVAVVALFSLWAVYGFAWQGYPLAPYGRDFQVFTALAATGHTGYLFGRLSETGWWYFYPVVWLVKTPIPFILALLIVGRSWIGRIAWRQAILWLPMALFLGLAMLSTLNVGYRYLLPIIPLLTILVGALPRRFPRPLGLAALGLWSALSTLAAAPHFLAYFNESVNPAQRYRLLADSNLDWGQDLPALADYLQGRPVNLSYFGQADAAYYGIHATLLYGWPPAAQRAELAQVDPAPGLYAISVSNLVGIRPPDQNPNLFAYFRDRPPAARLNGSIFVYDVPPQARVTVFNQCYPPQVGAEWVAPLLGRAPARQVLYDCAQTFLQPAAATLTLFGADQTPLVDLGPPVFIWRGNDGRVAYRLYRTEGGADSAESLAEGRYLNLLAYDLTPDALTMRWQVVAVPPPPVSIFVHFLGADGLPAGVYDALGVSAESWQPGDQIIQRHPVGDLPPGEYPVVIGLYSLADGTRYSDIPLTTYVKPPAP